MNNDEIEKLKRRLYRKGEVFGERETRSPLSPRPPNAKTYWEEPSQSEDGRIIMPEKPKSFFSKKSTVIFLIIFALAAIGGTIYFLTEGLTIISSNNIEIKMEGPGTIKGGELGEWQIFITNKNKTPLELAELIIEYPDGSKPVSNSLTGTKNSSERRSIGEIKTGQTANETIKAYLFGEKDTDKIFKITLEYRPEDSNAILAKESEQTVRLLQSPLEISIKMPPEANAGEEIDLNIDIFSNAQTATKDLTFKMEYPPGFQYLESDLKPISGDDIWRLGDLEPNSKRSIKIKGILEGQDLMELAFRASCGPLDEKGEIVPYGFAVQSILLKKPFLKLSMKVNNKTEEVIASPRDTLNIAIGWQNTLSEKINNAVIEVKLKSPAVDQRTISPTKGFYRSFDQVLVWNQSSFPELASIDPLQEGEAQFKFSILNPLPSSVISGSNPTITVEAEMRAERISEEGQIEIKNHLTKEIKIATVFQFNRRGLYYSGPFKNSGSLPPRIGRETTYTIVWSLTNSSSAVSDATISAYLPSYIRWLNILEPEDVDVSYNQNTGEIVWRAGTVPVGTGLLTAAKELAFQISFLPNVTQIGTQPVLVSEAVLGGKDVFTGAFLRDVKAALTTNLDADPQFKYNEAAVTQ